MRREAMSPSKLLITAAALAIALATPGLFAETSVPAAGPDGAAPEASSELQPDAELKGVVIEPMLTDQWFVAMQQRSVVTGWV